MLGLGAVGVVAGKQVQNGLDAVLRPLQQVDPTGLTRPAAGQLLPHLHRDRRLPERERRRLPPDGRRPGRPSHGAHPGGPAGHAGDPAGARLPVRHRVAGAEGALAGGGPVGAAGPGGRPALGEGAALRVLRRRVHREPHPRRGLPAGCHRRLLDAGRAGVARAWRPGAPLRGPHVRVQVAQVDVEDRGGRPGRARLLGDGGQLRRRRMGGAQQWPQRPGRPDGAGRAGADSCSASTGSSGPFTGSTPPSF